MFGLNLGRQKPGAPIAAKTLNDNSAQGERVARLRVGEGLAQTMVGGIPLVRSLGRQTIRYAKTGPGGISAAAGTTLGSGTIRMLKQNGNALDDTGKDEGCYNLFGAVTGDKLCLVGWCDRGWTLVGVVCP